MLDRDLEELVARLRRGDDARAGYELAQLIVKTGNVPEVLEAGNPVDALLELVARGWGDAQVEEVLLDRLGLRSLGGAHPLERVRPRTLDLVLRWVPGGEGEESFFVAESPVSGFQLAEVMGESGGADAPASGVSYPAARDFCARLTAREREAGWTFALPDEGQWERAVAAGGLLGVEEPPYEWCRGPWSGQPGDPAVQWLPQICAARILRGGAMVGGGRSRIPGEDPVVGGRTDAGLRPVLAPHPPGSDSAPPPPRGPRLVRILDGRIGPSIPLREGPLTIGRRVYCEVLLLAPTVAGRHTRVTRSGGEVMLEDLGSPNGTHLMRGTGSGERLRKPHRLVHGECFAVAGRYAYTFLEREDPDALAAVLAAGARSA